MKNIKDGYGLGTKNQHQISNTKAVKILQKPSLRWFRWGNDKFNTGYKVFTLFFSKRFDCYLFYYPKGSLIPRHKDPSFGYRHYRLNIVLKKPDEGGQFLCKKMIWSFNNKVYLFRADDSYHSCTQITKGTRILLGFGVRV